MRGSERDRSFADFAVGGETQAAAAVLAQGNALLHHSRHRVMLSCIIPGTGRCSPASAPAPRLPPGWVCWGCQIRPGFSLSPTWFYWGILQAGPLCRHTPRPPFGQDGESHSQMGFCAPREGAAGKGGGCTTSAACALGSLRLRGASATATGCSAAKGNTKTYGILIKTPTLKGFLMANSGLAL